MDNALRAKKRQHCAWVRLQLAEKRLGEAIQDRDGSRSKDPAARRELSNVVSHNWENVRAMRAEYDRAVEAAVEAFRALSEDLRYQVRLRFVEHHRAACGVEPKDCNPTTCAMEE